MLVVKVIAVAEAITSRLFCSLTFALVAALVVEPNVSANTLLLAGISTLEGPSGLLKAGAK